MHLSYRLATSCLALVFGVAQVNAEILTQYDAVVSGENSAPDLVDPPWELRGRPMTHEGSFLLQDTTSEFPSTAYGNYSSPAFAELMKAGEGEYGIEFRVRPVSDMLKAGGSHYANLMVAWGDGDRSFRISIDKHSEDETEGPGALVGKQDYQAKIADNIDWSEPHTIYIGYLGAQDHFNIYLDGELVADIPAKELAAEADPAFTGRVAFGDFTSGQAEPFNIDLKAEWYSVRLHDKADPAEAEKGGDAQNTAPKERPAGSALRMFSELSPLKQLAIRTAVAPPPTAQRDAPYSTPMYFPMWKVADSSGGALCGSSPDGKFHPEWQEALIRDWAEAGMTKLHLSLTPDGYGTPVRSYEISDLDRAGLTELARLAVKYGMKVGIRIDVPMDNEGYWPAHPRNPENELAAHAVWMQGVLRIFGPEVDYVVLGDEIDASRKRREDGKGWESRDFFQLVKTLAGEIREVCPQAEISMPAYGSGSWKEALQQVDDGFSKVGTAVAINIEDANVVTKYAQQLKEKSKNAPLAFLSNGVGYISSDVKLRNPDSDRGYYPYKDLDQAGLIAKSMYLCWSAGLQTAPYYIALRNIDYKGEVRPMWYGFFGFMDLVIDLEDRASIRRYPGWYAFQTVATTFYDMDEFRDPSFAVTSSNRKTSYIKAHERKDRKELLIVLWGQEGVTDVTIETKGYAFPVQVDLLNKDRWTDLSAVSNGQKVTLLDVPMAGTRHPVVIRMVAEKLGG